MAHWLCSWVFARWNTPYLVCLGDDLMSHAAVSETLPPLIPWGTTAVPAGRPSWSGLLQLSLVGIPLKAFPAVRARDLPTFHQLPDGGGQRIRYAKQCPIHGAVDAAAIVRAVEYGPGQHVVLEPQELDQLRPAQDQALRLERFLDPEQCDPLWFAGRGLY